jgi:hypothetical protein
VVIDFLPQHGPQSEQFLPRPDEIPDNWTAKFLDFNFQQIPPWGTDSQSVTATEDFLLTAINVFVSPVTDDVPCRVTIYHNHGKTQLQLMAEAIIEPGTYGTGAYPYWLKHPYLISAGDQVTVEISTYMAPPAGALLGPGPRPSVEYLEPVPSTVTVRALPSAVTTGQSAVPGGVVFTSTPDGTGSITFPIVPSVDEIQSYIQWSGFVLPYIPDGATIQSVKFVVEGAFENGYLAGHPASVANFAACYYGTYSGPPLHANDNTPLPPADDAVVTAPWNSGLAFPQQATTSLALGPGFSYAVPPPLPLASIAAANVIAWVNGSVDEAPPAQTATVLTVTAVYFEITYIPLPTVPPQSYYLTLVGGSPR